MDEEFRFERNWSYQYMGWKIHRINLIDKSGLPSDKYWDGSKLDDFKFWDYDEDELGN